MAEHVIYFKDWRTGRRREYALQQHEENFAKHNTICPFDKTPLLHFVAGDYTYCPNCRQKYWGVGQEDINKEAKENVDIFSREVRTHRENISRLLRLIRLYNKPMRQEIRVIVS